jgi:protein SCO1
MIEISATYMLSEIEFESLVDSIVNDPARHNQLSELLREDHELYDQRGAATTVRMRGWILIALSRVGVSDEALIFVLEELDTGADPYLVAAAARALRSYPKPSGALAPFVMRAFRNIRYRDDPVSFGGYGEFVSESDGTTPVQELLVTLMWLGVHAKNVLPDLESLRAEPSGLSKKLLVEVDRTIEVIRGTDEPYTDSCCTLPSGLRNTFSWALGSRSRSEPIESTVFEDQNNEVITFGEFFKGQPSIVVFFYTRCDNPLKCSLTITKLARTQKLLEEKGLRDQISTAAITYDPEFDMADRILGYGQHRGVFLNAKHRMLRPTEGIDSVRKHFKLGVNFIESLVNRHRVEAYILDAKGQIAAVYERIHWDEEQLVDRARELLCEQKALPLEVSDGREVAAVRKRTAGSILGTLFSVGFAFFPKCPICWAAYLSVFGIAGLDQIPYSPWLQPVFATVMLINLTSVWFRARATGRKIGFYLASLGALAIVVSKMRNGWEGLALVGIILTLAGSMLSALVVQGLVTALVNRGIANVGPAVTKR